MSEFPALGVLQLLMIRRAGFGSCQSKLRRRPQLRRRRAWEFSFQEVTERLVLERWPVSAGSLLGRHDGVQSCPPREPWRCGTTVIDQRERRPIYSSSAHEQHSLPAVLLVDVPTQFVEVLLQFEFVEVCVVPDRSAYPS